MTENGRSWTDEFIALRPLLFSLSYRMTSSVTDAEDIVSEAYLRLRRAVDGGTKITSLKTYLSSVVTRLSIDHLRSARMRREAYVGPWLPEPLIGTDSQADFERVEIADSLSMAFLVLLETLTPTERAVFLLREVFEFDYPRIAGMLGKSEPYCRQLLSRARQHVEARKPRFDADERERRRLAVRFFDAVEAGDLEPLVTMLADDVVTYGDGVATAPCCSSRSTAGTRCWGCWPCSPTRSGSSTSTWSTSPSTASPACWSGTAAGCCSACSSSTSSTEPSRPCAPSSTPTNCATSARSSARSTHCAAEAANGPAG